MPTASTPFATSYPILAPRSIWRSPRGLGLLFFLACLLLYYFNPFAETQVRVPKEWKIEAPLQPIDDIGTWTGEEGFPNSVNLEDQKDEWDAIKAEGERNRKEQEAQKKLVDEENRRKQEQMDAERAMEEEMARRKKAEEEEEARRRKDEEEKQQQKKKLEEDETRKKEEEEERRKKEEEEERLKKEQLPGNKEDTPEKNRHVKPGGKAKDGKESTPEQQKAADEQLKQADALDPANNNKDSSESSHSNSSTSDISVTVDTKNSGAHKEEPTNSHNLTTTLVVGRLDADPQGVQWIHDFVEDLTHKRIYIVDDPGAPLHLNQNKGREAMVYLRYILDFYDKLDDVTLFYHSSRMAWHNNVLFNRDAAVMINNLRRNYVVELGYMNARCELYPGCQDPGWIKWNPTREENKAHPERNADLFNKKLWDQLFPGRTKDPVYLSEPCCSQFAVSRDTIRSVPKEQFQRIHDWLATTDEVDGFTGRIMEYVWQYLFLNKEHDCPSMRDCYCKGYGTCLIDDTELVEYNQLRTEVDVTLGKLGAINAKNGCGEIEDEEKKNKCREGNPYEEPLKEIRRRKQAYEKRLPLKYGIIDPLGVV